MTKELLTVEFRHHDEPRHEHDSTFINKVVTIGMFDTLTEAVDEGNKTLAILAKSFEVRPNDRFQEKDRWGLPKRLVTNTCYPTNGVQYFAKIEKMSFIDEIQASVRDAFEASARFREYRKEQDA